MPKPFTCPNLVDDYLLIRVSTFTNKNFMRPNMLMTRGIYWNVQSGEKPEIKIGIDTSNGLEAHFIYKVNDENREYIIPIVSVPSNLSKGIVYYFLCPRSGKKCRKLFLYNGWFMHREAIPNGMYWSQTHSKRWREIGKLFAMDAKRERAYEAMYKPYYKKTYNGKITKKHQRTLEVIRLADVNPFNPRDYLFNK